MNCCICGNETIQAKDGRCCGCRLKSFVNPIYVWTPEADAKLTRLYREVKNRKDLTERMTALARELRFPRYILANRATALKLKFCTRQPWTDEEVAMLRELSGEKTLRRIARLLKRSPHSVKHKMWSLGLSFAVTEGFSRKELAALMGVNHARVERWIARGWLMVVGSRVTHESISRFLWNHMQEYRFASCDEWWLKTMLKPEIGIHDREMAA